MRRNIIVYLFIFFTVSFPLAINCQVCQKDVKISNFEKLASGTNVCVLDFTVKEIEANKITKKSIVQFIVDSTDLLKSAAQICQFKNEEWDDKNRLILYQKKMEKGKKQTMKFQVEFYVYPPFVFDLSKCAPENIFKSSIGLNIMHFGPYQTKKLYDPNGILKCNDCAPEDSLMLMIKKCLYSDYDIQQLRERAKKLESLKIEKAEYEKYIDSLDVLAIIMGSISKGDINYENAKIGAVLTHFNKNISNRFSKQTYYFNDEELENLELKYIGTISPLTGILQCRRSGVLLTEYKIVDSLVSALRIYERPYGNPVGELIIDFTNNKYKAIYYMDYLNWWTYAEGTIPKSQRNLDLQNIKKIRKHLYVYGTSNNSVKHLIEKGISSWYESGEKETNQGVWLSSVSHTELTDELSNSDILLSKKSSVTYKNRSNKEYDYFLLDFQSNDSVSSLTRIGELNGGKKYLQSYTFTKGSYLKEFYQNYRIDSTFSEHEIAGNKWKSQTPSAHIPLAVSTKRISDSLYHVLYKFNKKLLFDAVLNIKSEIVGTARIYSISSPLLKQYRTANQSVEERLNSIFKISLSFLPVKNEYSSALSQLVNLKDFSPNDNKTIGLHYLHTNLMPLATSPLGTEITLKGSPTFVDRTEDYLAQKAIFENGKLMAMYVYMPNGECFDSLNLGLNEFGEQIGKSSVNDFPFSDRYLSLYNQAQKETEERQMQAMVKLLEALKKNDNTCDHCKKSLTDTRIDIYDIDCPNGHSYLLNSKRRFCSLKCHSDYKKYWCELQSN
jgi:hypothetical protein